MWFTNPHGVKYSISPDERGKFRVEEMQVPVERSASSVEYRQIVPSKTLADQAFDTFQDAVDAANNEIAQNGVRARN